MGKTLEMVFTTDKSKSSTVSVEDPKEPVDVDVVKAIMDKLISEGAFATSSGKLASKKTIRIVDRSVQEYTM